MAVREYAGAAKRTALASGITATDTTITLADATGYPTGATGPFAIALDLGVAAEEKVLVASRSGNTLTVPSGGRGYDGTTAAAHGSGSSADHVLTAVDVREANGHVNDTTGDPHPQYLTPADVAANTVQAFETTTSTVYTDLATVGPSHTVTVGASGRVLVVVTADINTNLAGVSGHMSFALTGANTQSPDDARAVSHTSGAAGQASRGSAVEVITGLAPGATTFTSKYRISAAAEGRFFRRHLTVIPL